MAMQQTEGLEITRLEEVEPNEIERDEDDRMREQPDERENITNGRFDICEFPELKEFDKANINTIYEKCTDLNIIVAGLTGSGKSSLANAIVGSEDMTAFKVGDNLDHCTNHVTPTRGETAKFLRVWDSPGLFDGTNNNRKYLREIKTVVRRFQPGDLMLFCIETKARFVVGRENNDLKALLKIKRKFGPKVFQKIVIALTFADNIASRAPAEKQLEHYKTTIQSYENDIRRVLETHVKIDRDLAQKIPMFPVQHQQNSSPILPDGTRWLSRFWFGCLNAIPDLVGKANWIKHFENRIVDKADPDPGRTKFILTDDFLPEKLLEMKKQYKAKGKKIGMLGLLGGPLALLTIPMGVWAGGKKAEIEFDAHVACKKN